MLSRRMWTSILPSIIVGLTAAGRPGEAAAGTPPRAEIRDALKRGWDAVDTLEVRGEEFPCDDEGRRAVGPKSHTMTFDLKCGTGGRRALKLTDVAPDGKRTVLLWFQEDGRKKYLLTPFPDDADAIDVAHAEGQTDTSENSTGAMTIFLWLWTPRGRPLYAYLDEGAALDSVPEPGGGESVVMSFRPNKKLIRCVLDPAHDWLPRVVEAEGSDRKEVTEFRREGGLWFPVAGTQRQLKDRPNRPKTVQGFRIDALHVNRPLPASTFGPTGLPDGTLVVDRVSNKSDYRGGRAARKALEAKHPVAVVPGRTVVASREPERFPWRLVIAAASILCLAAAWWSRRGRRDHQAARGD